MISAISALEQLYICLLYTSGSESAPPSPSSYHVKKLNYVGNHTLSEKTVYQIDNDYLWKKKLEEIRQFQYEKTEAKLTKQQVENLIRIYEKYRHVFSEAPGKVKNYQCKIRFKEQVEFHKKSYPIAYSLKEAVRTEINRMIDDIIEHSHSPYTSPIVAIPKKNGQVRLCLDVREINKMIVNDRTSPGKIEQILKKFHGTKVISTWDTVCGYWQVELHPHSRQYMAFIFEGHNYLFKRLPFGLINSVAIFVKCMDQILGQDVLLSLIHI